MRFVSGFVLAALLTAWPAAAQDAPVVSLGPGDPARWDAAGLVGWRGGNKSDVAPAWNEWYDAGSFGASLGYYWTRHIKFDLAIATTTDGTVPVEQQIVLPGQPFPIFRYGEHRFRATSLSGGLQYQFGENSWFHPFVGVGVDVVRERTRLDFRDQFPCDRLPCAPAPGVSDDSTSSRARPFATLGFKLYMTERAFIRSDIRSAFARDHGIDAVTWQIGIGADF